MPLFRGMDDSDPVRSDAITTRPEYRRTHSTRIATGTLACPRCDAPVALAGAVSPADHTSCPYCSQHGRVHEFLSLEPPSRPAHVQVTVRLPAPRRAPIQI